MWTVIYVLFQMVLSKKCAKYDYGSSPNRTYGQVFITTISVTHERLVLRHCQL